MAIQSNSNTKTTKIFLSGKNFAQSIAITTNIYDNGFKSDGTWDTSVYATAPTEDDYIDIGFVNDEREELTIGGIPIALPGTGADQAFTWAIMGKILRVTISGTIPDGIYIPTYGDSTYGTSTSTYKSNSSIFRYKMSKLIAYQGVPISITAGLIHNIKYRRKYLTDYNEYDEISNWAISSYSFGFIEGTRTLKYSITLDLSNNGHESSSHILPKQFGDI